MSRVWKFAAVLFDMDGVILDSMQQHAALWQELLAGQGFQVPREFILHNEGSLGAEVLERLFREQGREQAGLVQAQAGMGALLSRQAELYLERHADQVRTFPGAEDLLAGLAARGVPTALVTSSRRALVQRCLEEGLRRRFAAIVTAEDVARHKPHPEPYLTAARSLGLDPARCLVVENAPAGIASARAAGATCFAVCSTLGPAELLEAQAVFPNLEALAAELALMAKGGEQGR
jgi:beta-phosphoglucomutase